MLSFDFGVGSERIGLLIYDKNGLDAAASGFSQGALFVAVLLIKLLLILLLFIPLNW